MHSVNLPTANLRIVSLIPSATEIVAALGYGGCLIGRSHECDFPASVKTLPICTEPKFDPVGSSEEIHQRVSELLASALSVYRVKTEVLQALRPTHIITQAQCEVCAVSLSDVEQAVKQLMADADNRAAADVSPIEIISLQPERLSDVWADITRVASSLSGSQENAAQRVVAESKVALASYQPSAPEKRPRVACIEWTEPLMAAGNWVPELVSLAGGVSCFGKAGEHSNWLEWSAIAQADPDIIVVMPCGYDLAQTRQATEEMAQRKEWKAMTAVKAGRVYLVDGNQYFNRPGPRLVESGEILAEIIQNRPINRNRAIAGWEKFNPLVE